MSNTERQIAVDGLQMAFSGVEKALVAAKHDRGLYTSRDIEALEWLCGAIATACVNTSESRDALFFRDDGVAPPPPWVRG